MSQINDSGMSEGEYQETYGAWDGPIPEVWTTRDGRSIVIREMDDSHLVNTIRFLRRNALNDDEYLNHRCPQFRVMMAEAERRKLAV